MPPERKSMRERGRESMLLQFKTFYRENIDELREMGARNDKYVLLLYFAKWLNARSMQFVPDLSEKVTNIVMSRTLPDWNSWCTVVDTAAEET